jgi:hypothetical protein
MREAITRMEHKGSCREAYARRSRLWADVAILLCALVPGLSFEGAGRPVEAKTCAQMRKELAGLRQEYHRMAGDRASKPTFDGLAEVLDKILDLKRSMREVNCKIPNRVQSVEPAKSDRKEGASGSGR